MKVAIVDAYYLPDQGYQSGPLFRQLVKQGHDVHVFTSCYYPRSMRTVYQEPFPAGDTPHEGGWVHRLPSKLLPRNMVSCPAVAEAVLGFQPDLTYVIYVTTLYGQELFRCREILPGALFGSFGEHSMQRMVAPLGFTRILRNSALDAAFFVKKRPVCRRCIETSDAALFITPDTFNYILGRTASGARRAALERRCALYPLGFDPDIFHYDEATRQARRAQLGFTDDDLVAVHACKIVPSKQLHDWIAVVENVMRKVPSLRGVLVGFRDRDAESDRLKALIAASPYRERFTCLPFARREELAAICNMADIGVWFRETSVTIQEALGTGLYMLVNDNLALAHLLDEPTTGHYARDGDYGDLEALLARVADEFSHDLERRGPAARQARAAASRDRLGYDRLAQRLVAAAQDRANAVAQIEGGNAWGSCREVRR